MAIRSTHDVQNVHQFGHQDSGLRRFDRTFRQSDTDAPSHTGITVRPYHLHESGLLAGLRDRTELRFPESAFVRPGFGTLFWRRLSRADTTDQPLYLALDCTSGSKIGALQCRQQPADDRWHLQFLAQAAGISNGFDVQVAMLEHAIYEAGKRGARRVLARVDVESPVTESLRAVGFAPYAREQVYLINTSAPAHVDSRVRSQHKSDLWSIHQLYLQTTPRDVQNAEALTSHAWSVDTDGRSQRGWFMTNDNGVCASVRVRTARPYHVVEVMTTPETRADLAPVLATALATLRSESPRQIFLLLRGYQVDVGQTLATFIGAPIAGQFLMVKYTTAPAARRAAEVFELLRPVEADPQRVPSFCVRDIHEQC